MSPQWPKEELGKLLRRNAEQIDIKPDELYKEITARLWGKGIVLRGVLPGSSIASKRRYVAHSGQFIISRIDARHGSMGIVPDGLEGAVVTNDYPLFDVDSTKLDSNYLSWLCKTRDFIELCSKASEGTTNRVRLKEDRFLSLEIPLPPLDEQRRIVARIEDMKRSIEEAATLQHKMIVESEAVLLGHLKQVFGNPYNDEAGEIGDVTIARLNDVVIDVADGPHITPQYTENGIPFITVLNITSGRIQFTNNKFISEDDHKQFQKRAKAEKGDVLISKDGTIGIPCFIDTEREFSYFVSVALIKPDRRFLDGEYLYWVLHSPYLQDRIQEKSRGDMIRHLVLREIRDLSIPLPDILHQRALVERLNVLKKKFDELKELNEECITYIEALMPSILDKAFKGEL